MLFAEGDPGFVGEVLLAHIGIAAVGHTQHAVHVGQRVLGLVEQLHAVVQLVVDVDDMRVGLLVPAGHGGAGVVQLVKRIRGSLLGGAVGVAVGEGVLQAKAWHRFGQPQQFAAQVQRAEVLVRAVAGKGRVGVVDERVACRVVQRHAAG
ncbi:hypothetical protein D3C80_1713650 [compost metagenome]